MVLLRGEEGLAVRLPGCAAGAGHCWGLCADTAGPERPTEPAGGETLRPLRGDWR